MPIRLAELLQNLRAKLPDKAPANRNNQRQDNEGVPIQAEQQLACDIIHIQPGHHNEQRAQGNKQICNNIFPEMLRNPIPISHVFHLRSASAHTG